MKNKIAAYLFPRFCIGCDEEGVWICDACERCVDPVGLFRCPSCDQATGDGRPCPAHRDAVLGRHVAVAHFSHADNLVAKSVELWKYRYVRDLETYISRWLRQMLMQHPYLFADIDAVLPIPLHPRRFAERGFNQADIIAQVAANFLDLPMRRFLRRTRYTKQQAKLSHTARRDNLDAAFVASPTAAMPAHVLLVDDVYTSGTTMRSAAEEVKKAGAEQVSGLSVLRG